MKMQADRVLVVAGLLIGAAGVNATPASAQQSSGPIAQQPASATLTEIVVTANKRSEKLKDVATSITAIGAATITTQGIQGFDDYLGLVPSLSDFSGGAEGHGAVVLRALNTGYYQTSNTVGFYINDVPVSASSPLSVGALLTPDPDLLDVDQVEVLKGPQGTIYGSSSLGGLIKVTTAKPNLTKFSGSIDLSGSSVDGGGLGGSASVVLNAPLIPDKLALRIVGFSRDDPGYMTNITLGLKDQNTSHNYGGRISLLWEPVDRLHLNFVISSQDVDTGGFGNEYLDPNTLKPIYGNYTYAQAVDPNFKTSNRIYSATVDYHFPTVGTVTNALSYATYRDKEIEDYSPYVSIFDDYAPTPVPNDASQVLVFGPTLDKLTNELRFASDRLGRFQGIGGVYFTKEDTGYPTSITNVIAPSLKPISGPSGYIQTANTLAQYLEVAGFANLTYYVLPQLDVTLGGRYSYNQLSDTAAAGGFTSTPGESGSSSESDTDFTYLATIRWRPLDNIATYATISSAYRPGGPQFNPLPGTTNFQPDTVVNYEVGLKGNWLEGRLQSDIAAYYIDWRHVQLGYIVGDLEEVGNAGRAHSEGIEADAQFRPLRALTLGGTLAYNNAILTQVGAATTAAIGAVSGDRLPFTPHWTASFTADYKKELGSGLRGTLGMTYKFQGSKPSDYPNNPLNTGVTIPSYEVFDIRSGLEYENYTVQFRVSNLLGSRGLDAIVNQRADPSLNAPYFGAMIRPRTFTLDLSAKF